jgi:hypothetical protein
MFQVKTEHLNNEIHRYRIYREDASISYADTLDLWQQSERFRFFFISLLAESPFSAYRWETPPITSETVTRPFEFVLINAPFLLQPPDGSPFESYFSNEDSKNGVVSFMNLGGDALLVAPCPQGTESAAYVHLASFIRDAPEIQKNALWQKLGQEIQREVSFRPLWVSTAGGGVDWLHVRLDSRPKYIAYAPYKS